MANLVKTSFALLVLVSAGCETPGTGPAIQPSAYSVGLLAETVAAGGADSAQPSPPDSVDTAAPPSISQETVDELTAELESIADGFVGISRQLEKFATVDDLQELKRLAAEFQQQYQQQQSAKPWMPEIESLDAKITKLSDRVEWNRKELQKAIERQTECPPVQKKVAPGPKKLDSVTYDGRRVIWEYTDGSRLQETHRGFQQRTGKIFSIQGADIYCPSGTCQWR